jgi:hypothetical protein
MPDSSMLSMPKIIQLTIWDRLDLATTNSVGADFLGLLSEVDESIEQLLPADRLSAAGEAIRRLGEIYAYRSAEQLSEIEYLFHPEQEPILPLDAFDRYVRQSMMVDLEQFIGAIELPEYEREYNLTVVRERSKAEVLAEIEAAEACASIFDDRVDKEVAYQQAIALAHDENVSQWGQAISMRLDEWDRAVSLLELQEAIEMPLVQVWLGLLLNGLTIEQRGDFYDTEQVWILR